MISSKGMEATIKFFLNFIKMRSLEIRLAIIMSDHDHVQMNAIKAVYLELVLPQLSLAPFWNSAIFG